MPRVTPDEVNATAGSTQALLLAIEAASAVVDTLVGQGFSDAVLKLIELSLVKAYLYEDGLSGTVESERIGDASITYRTSKENPHWLLAVRLSGGLLLNTGARKATFDVYV